MCNGCMNCAVKCGDEKAIIERMKKAYKNPKRICMNQATYEAITGQRLEICDLCVDIDNRIKDKSYLIIGD